MGDGRVGNRPLTGLSGRVSVFLDRDGVLNEPVWDPHVGRSESPLAVEDVVLTDGAALAVRRINDMGLPVVIVSNQPSAAKGLVDVATIEAIHDRVLELLAAQGAVVERSYLCLHHPDGTVPGLGNACDCRKPAPGLLLRAAVDLGLDLPNCWMVGDTDADTGAAKAADLAGIVLVANPLSAHRRSDARTGVTAVTPSVSEAVDVVLEQLRTRGSLPVS